MQDAIKHLLPESRKDSRSQRRYCLTRCTFWGNYFSLFLGKKKAFVKPLWIINLPYISSYLKVHFLRMGDFNVSDTDHLSTENLIRTSSLTPIHLLQMMVHLWRNHSESPGADSWLISSRTQVHDVG